jgi:hypothetical protein
MHGRVGCRIIKPPFDDDRAVGTHLDLAESPIRRRSNPRRFGQRRTGFRLVNVAACADPGKQ